MVAAMNTEEPASALVGEYRLTFATWREQGKKTRIYVSFPSDEEVEEASGIPHASLRYTVRGEDPEIDKLFDRWNRWVVKLSRPAALEAARWLAGGDEVRVNFSRHAGCSCPCSPGLVADRVLSFEGRAVVNVSPKG